MKLEIGLLKEKIKKYSAYNDAPSEQLKQLEGHFVALIAIFRTQDEASEYDFSISKDMVIILHEILTTNEEKEFEALASEYEDQEVRAAAHGLYLWRGDNACYNIMREMLMVFSGRCLSIASTHAESAKGKVLRFTQTESEETLEDLVKQRDLALENFKAVSTFCFTHRLS